MEAPLDNLSDASDDDDDEDEDDTENKMIKSESPSSVLNQSLKITDLGASITSNSLQYVSIMDGV